MNRSKKRIAVALGGNALGNTPTEQLKQVKIAAETIVELAAEGHELIVGHGNGPQVGIINSAMNYAAANGPHTPYMPFAECGAMSQGFIGYHLQQALQQSMRKRGMNGAVVICDDGHLEVVENRNLKKGDKVILGRSEKCEEGIHMHCNGFTAEGDEMDDQFVFRQGRSRETSYARDYDNLFELLRHEREHGNIVWVMGPAFSFDYDARAAMQALVENGYAHGLMAGNALATHDLEGALLHTALGQDIYTQKSQPNGHYNHLDVINKVRRSGSIPQFIEDYKIDNGIIYSCVKNNVPFVLTGSIRDDGPMPEVIGDAYKGQSEMRNLVKKSTTVICLATMLHTIATGNMTPSFRVMPDGEIRPVYLYTVDADEFVVNKLLDRGSLSATTIVTNVQDFISIVAKGLGVMK